MKTYDTGEISGIYRDKKWEQECAAFKDYGPGVRSVYLESKGMWNLYWMSKTDKGKIERQHKWYNTKPIWVKLKGPPFTICVTLEEPMFEWQCSYYYYITETEIIQLWIFLSVSNFVRQKHPTHITY